jgi:dolichol-phosphate mannosyltransferase
VTVATGSSPGSISVVIPARNEAARISPLLEASVGAPGVSEVIVVDDESSDATADLAARFGARVVAAGLSPEGWAGKAWALQRGVEAATGDWVVALDADTRPAPDLPTALVARAEADGTDLLTVAGRFDGASRGARWLHAAMLTTLVYRFGPPGQSPRGVGRVLANGQCMAFRRQALLAAGGFAAVADSVVEDVAVARHLVNSGRSVDFLDASELLTVELYDSLAATWRGWGRSIGLPGVEPVWRQLLDVAVLTLSLPLPLARLVVGRCDPIDLIALVARLATLAGTRTAFARNDRAYWISPLADLIAVAAVAKSVMTRQHFWSGRLYEL